ncbi:MAG: ATP-binding protein [Gammaproteobacteria bacterium]
MAQASGQSLFRRLLGGFMLVMLLIWLAALARIYVQAKNDQQRHTAIVNQGWTRQIMLNVRSVAHDAAEVRRVAERIEALRLDMFRQLGFTTEAHTTVSQHGRLLYASARVAAEGEDWVHWREEDPATGLVVERSEHSDPSWMFAPSAAGYLLTPLAYSLPFLLIPAWLIVRLGLRPLRAMGAAIEQRNEADLAPLPASPYRELSPLVEAINRLMKRLSQRLEREHEFLTDAAHELKTPLSVIQLNAHLLGSAVDERQRRDADAGLREGVVRASHTVHQLLAFERARDDTAPAPLPLEDLTGMVRDRLAVAAPLALQRGIDIELKAPPACPLRLHRESLAALLDNVIGNAIKYSPSHGHVEVELARHAAGVTLSVLDQGPGIVPELRHKVFERFYRVPGQDQPGSGLGLSIAERAAARNGARIRLEGAPAGPGLRAVIEFATEGGVDVQST